MWGTGCLLTVCVLGVVEELVFMHMALRGPRGSHVSPQCFFGIRLNPYFPEDDKVLRVLNVMRRVWQLLGTAERGVS